MEDLTQVTPESQSTENRYSALWQQVAKASIVPPQNQGLTLAEIQEACQQYKVACRVLDGEGYVVGIFYRDGSYEPVD